MRDTRQAGILPHTPTKPHGKRLSAKAKSYLQKLVLALAKENKPVRWTTPAGFPFVNQYNKPRTKPVKLWLRKGETHVKHTIKTAVDELPKIDGHEAKKGIAPNFVHACDAAHLMLTVNAAVAEGITSIATVHDSFGCLPSQAERFRHIIREQFVRMYEQHDVLAEVLEWARKDLGELNAKQLPSGPPQKGSLNINEVLKAEFAFA
jgi:DNA-directed RNA polymerase, mitochondrial